MYRSLFQQGAGLGGLSARWVPPAAPGLFFDAFLGSLIAFLATLALCRTAFAALARAVGVPLAAVAVHLSEGVTYLAFVSAAWGVVPTTDCFWDPAKCFADHAAPGVRLDVALLYCLQVAGYLNMLWVRFALPRLYGTESPGLTADTVLHHGVTLLLLGGSWSYRYTSVGCLVFLLHDPSSIFLKLTRIVERGGHRRVQLASFAAFAALFFALRLVGMPLLVGRAVFLYGPAIPSQRALTCLLCLLYGLNVVWFLKIAEILARAFAHPTTEEIKLLDPPTPPAADKLET